jgi:poly(beta-D-mannuronate) lyase
MNRYLVFISFLTNLLIVPLLVKAGTVNVASNSELTTAIGKAAAGDVIILADGNYNGLHITKSGTSSNPIVIQAKNVGAAIITSGVVNLDHVAYVILDGLKFTTSGASVSVDDTSRYAALSLINANNCRITRCTFSLKSAHANTYLITIGGDSNNNEIDHSEFGPHTTADRQVYNFIYKIYYNPNKLKFLDPIRILFFFRSHSTEIILYL